jgi:glycosyltransferase involved in cell wall biosynthesis
MRRVLIVAYYFPPLGGIGSLRVSGFASHLPEYGWEPTVLAPRNGAYYRDPHIAFPERQVIRTPSIELSRTGKRVLRTGGSDVAAASVGGARGAVRRVARSALYFPDAQVGWYAPALITARRALREHRFDAIFSSSFPITAHLIARRLHRWLGIPWIAEFRDPWSAMLGRQGRSASRAARLERALARESSRVVMTSPSWADLHSRLWDRELDVIPNGHSGSTRSSAPTNDEFSLGYLGSYYPATQRLDAVWDAVRAINEAGGPRVDRLRFVGDLHPDLRRALRERGLEPLVDATGFLSHEEALLALARSSLVLAPGPYYADGMVTGHVAAKLAECLATDLPILYVGDLDCDAADLLRRYPGCGLVNGDDVDGAVAAVHASRGRRFERDVEDLSRRRLTAHLAAVLDEACESSRRTDDACVP